MINSAVIPLPDRLETLLADDDFVLCRRSVRVGILGPAHSVLAVEARSEHARPAAIRILKYEHSLRDESIPAWASRDTQHQPVIRAARCRRGSWTGILALKDAVLAHGDVVRFLRARANDSIGLWHCSPGIPAWMAREGERS
jgi:hypothetical protein